jgi:hypothetical protein
VQTQVSCNNKNYDHDANDVENIHCVLRLRLARPQYEVTIAPNENVWDVSKFHTRRGPSATLFGINVRRLWPPAVDRLFKRATKDE